MRNALIIIVVAALLLTAGQLFASEVTNVELSYVSGSTVATIQVDGAIRFTHQTEQAKDGKPFRVIVDVLTANHGLGANNFLELPACPIRAIRTSQYSVRPEAVVRIVFDMEAEQVYRVESDDKAIMLHFADNAGRSFAAWSTASVMADKKKGKSDSAPAPVTVKKADTKVASAPPAAAEKSAKELNKSIDKDRLASLEPKSSGPAMSPARQSEKPAQTAAKPVKTQPVAATTSKPIANADKSSKKSAVQMPKLSQSEAHYGPFVDATLLEKNEPAKTSAPQTKQPAAADSKESPAPVTTKAKVPVANKPKAPEMAKAEPVQTAPMPVATVDDKETAAQSDASAKKATSRFRRDPVTSKKIKGTLVAEFPKRLVIKYKATHHRDPFATLIDESKTYDDPIERQVPNVEGLKLVGVIEAGSKDNRALFEDDEGYGYILKTGDKVQKGYVLRVEADRVYFQIFEYGWSRTVALHLES